MSAAESHQVQAQQRLVEALLRPECYPHPVQHVTRIETHISTILLAGDYAYKLKKPLQLPFLDFSSLDKRRFFCEEELRLNRRLAPQWYLRCLPVTGSLEAPRLGGADAPVLEYALQMRRFPQEALLDRALAEQRLTPAVLDILAERLASFHAATDRSAGAPSAKYLRPLRDNLDELAPLLAPAERPLFERVAAFMRAELQRLQPLLRQRHADGAVRECHGDLHLGNIAWLADRAELLIFDGIEFDPALRWLDVSDELAFLLMDLQRRGAVDYANRLRNGYLEHSGDYAGVPLLPLYQCHRALVRAKVTLLRAGQLSGAAAAQGREEAAGYLRLAASYGAPRRPMLAICFGPAASGKSTLAQQLVDRLGFLRLRSDVERKRLHGLAASDRSGAALAQGMYGEAATRATYQHLLELADGLLQAGQRVILDATFLQRAPRRAAQALAAHHGCPFAIIALRADRSTLRARIERRRAAGERVSEADLEVLEHQLSSLDSLEEGELNACFDVDTEDANSLERLLKRLPVDA